MFKCECGKEFEKSQSFNAHKASCREHYLIKYGNLDYWNELQDRRGRKISKTLHNKVYTTKQQKLMLWVSEKHTCEKCGKVMTEKYGSRRFCSSNCAHKYASQQVNRNKLHEGRKKYADKVVKENEQNYLLSPNYCCVCGAMLPYELRNRKTCSTECYKVVNKASGRIAGLASAKARSEICRSKNEIYFCELCEKHFKDVKHNEPIFNGWDADVIIEDIKYAILWNGPWHYRKITEKHSVEQVQNRDRIKLIEIEKAGYTSYIVKDDGKYDPAFVEEQFRVFLNSL